MNDLLEWGLMWLGIIGVFICLFFLYFIICILLGIFIEAILGWLGKDVADWYWSGVGLVALLGAVVSAKSSKD